MYLGVDYYPEHWNENMLNEDLDNIIELGSNVIRIGEFAWHMMEKVEGQYDFSYFDHVIAKGPGIHRAPIQSYANSSFIKFLVWYCTDSTVDCHPPGANDLF